MSWWSRLLGRKPAPTPAPRSHGGPGPRASWIPADDSGFGIPVLDLASITGALISTSSEPEQAEMSVSWAQKLVADLDLTFTAAESMACDLRYTVEPELPDGWLFVPPAMEQKWAIAYRDSAIHLIRSWTGDVRAAGRARREGDQLIVDRIELADDTLRVFGAPVEIFDWTIRAHALDQRVPLPADAQGAAMLESVPLSVFSLFGNVAAFAATRWSPPPQTRPLRTIGDLTTAVRIEDAARVRALVAAGAPIDARSPMAGFTALHVAVVKRDVALARLLLELGADPNVLGDRDTSVVITAVVHSAPTEILDLLVKHGAVATTPNADGFGMVHAIAETDHAAYLAWALAHGLALEARNRHGHTPLHVAAALGHLAALRALLEAGADPSAKDPSGKTARDIAIEEGKPASVKALDAAR